MRYENWLHYFEANKDHFNHIDWKLVKSLTENEIKLISASIKQFQRGEHSEGKHFLRYAGVLKDPTYMETVKLFIKEEQDHAAILGTFMDHQGIERIGRDWLDNTFRFLRKLSGLEVTVTVLLTAEIMAFPFYKALSASTGNRILQQICEQILTDEEMHIRFQSYTLIDLYRGKSKPSLFISRLLHRTLMAGTIMIVWIWHRKVLKTGGYSFLSHFKHAWLQFARCERMLVGKEDNQPCKRSRVQVA